MKDLIYEEKNTLDVKDNNDFVGVHFRLYGEDMDFADELNQIVEDIKKANKGQEIAESYIKNKNDFLVHILKTAINDYWLKKESWITEAVEEMKHIDSNVFTDEKDSTANAIKELRELEEAIL